MHYSQIASPYIKSLISQTSWENHSIIDDLIKLEEYIRKGGPTTYNGGLQFASLKYQYHTHYLNLLREIDPVKYEHVILDIENEKKIAKVSDARISQETEESRNDWINAGGK